MSDLPDSFFKTLDSAEEAEFRAWARENFIPGQKISPVWHPVVRDECRIMTEEQNVRPEE